MQVFCQTPCARGGSTTAKRCSSEELRAGWRRGRSWNKEWRLRAARRRNCALRSRRGSGGTGVASVALRAKIDAAATCPAVHPATRRGRAAEAPTAGLFPRHGRRRRWGEDADGGARGWRIQIRRRLVNSREYLFDRARWSGRPKFSAASTAWTSAMAPFYRVRSFSAAARDAETGVRARYRRFLGRAAFLALLLEML